MAVLTTATEAITQVVRSGQVIMVGGFGLVGAPLTLLRVLAGHDVQDLTVISNNLGEPGRGLGVLLQNGQVRKAIGSYFTSNPDVVKAYQAGNLDVMLLPQGTLAEAIRAGGAGLGGFCTPTGLGTELMKDATTATISGKTFVLQPALRADVALIRARYADRFGNLTYYKTARNFNPLMATAADVVIAEVDEIVEPGALDPELVVTPHPYVQFICRAEDRLEV